MALLNASSARHSAVTSFHPQMQSISSDMQRQMSPLGPTLRFLYLTRVVGQIECDIVSSKRVRDIEFKNCPSFGDRILLYAQLVILSIFFIELPWNVKLHLGIKPFRSSYHTCNTTTRNAQGVIRICTDCKTR